MISHALAILFMTWAALLIVVGLAILGILYEEDRP